MKQLLRNVKIILVFFLILSVATLAGLVVQQRRSETHFRAVAGENKQILRERYRQAGKIIAADGVILADSSSGERTYAADPQVALAMLHIVGDYTHNITNTIESQLQGPLLGNRSDLLKQLNLDVRGLGYRGDDVHLTISSSLSSRAYQLMGGQKGAVVLLNYRTGDVIAAVSSPSALPANVISWVNIPDGSLFNRALNGRFIPGSTFKIITTSAWLGSAAYDAALHVDCEGHVPVIESGAFENYAAAAHGRVDLTAAFCNSCNIFYGQVGMDVGAASLEAEAAAFGFGRTLGLPYLTATASRIQVTRDDLPLLSWAAVGQPAGDTVETMSPLHLAMIAGAVANDGRMMVPHVVGSLTDPLGERYGEREVRTLLNVPARTWPTLKQLMTAAVQIGTGTAAQVAGHTIGGKTGTMETRNEAGETEVYTLFTGFDATPGYPYAVAVILENKGYSGAQIAGDLLARTAKIGP